MTRPIKFALVFIGLSALTALSPQARAEQQAPDYFVEVMFNTTTAERLAQFCPTVTVNAVHAQLQSEALVNRLTDEGYGDVTSFGTLAGLEEGVAELQAAFLETHALAGAGPDRVCEVAQAEIENATALGAYLMVIDG
ncbi:DUF5333 family protein [Shimia ponticola]|uniref:DUF5333 family protein n=1 Tax=Shimia ponticola TaxID=2582893 RepID=UPI0011BE4C97|nr:DUF5333 family protein [Shimia ponticola]